MIQELFSEENEVIKRGKKIFISDLLTYVDGEERLRSVTLTEKELSILRTLESKKYDGIMLSELSKRYGNYVYKIIYDMEGWHVVEIVNTEKYGKRKVVKITELGEKVLDKLSPKRTYRLFE